MKINFKFRARLPVCLILLLHCSFASFVAPAQSRFQKGYVVTNNLDTLRGYIDQKEWTRNPGAVSFQKAQDDHSPKGFTLKDIIYFQIDGGEGYRRYTVMVSMDKVSLENLGPPGEKSVMDTVFLRILQKGKFVTLLSYRDKLKNRFYLLEKEGDVPSELIYKLYSETFSNDRYSSAESKALTERSIETYKNQLVQSAQRAGAYSDKLEWQIKKASYSNESLLSIVDKINGVRKTMTKRDSKIGLAFYVGAGLNVSNLTYSGGGEWNKSSSSSSSPYFTVGINLLGNRDVGKIMLKGEISWSTAKFHMVALDDHLGYPQRIDYTFTQNTISPSLHFLYALYNSQSMKIYLGAGLRMNLSSYSDNLYTIETTFPKSSPNVSRTKDFFQLEKMWYSGVLQGGVSIRNKLEITVSYNAGSPLNQYQALWAESIKAVRAGLNYRLWKK